MIEKMCWEEYLYEREVKWQEVGENCTMRSFVTWTLRQIYTYICNVKPKGMRPLRRKGRRWVDIKMDLGGIDWKCMDRIDLAQDGDQWMVLVNTERSLCVPQYVGKFVSSCTTFVFSRRARVHEISRLFRCRFKTNCPSIPFSKPRKLWSWYTVCN
jgi:hypothetical protein